MTQKDGQGGQALTTTQQGGALAVAQELSFNLPALSDPQEAMEVMADNLAELGGNLKFDKVKIPSGGGLSFEIIDENGEEKAVTEVEGVVLDHFPVNVFWEHKFSGESNPPDCSSMDAVIGTIMVDGKPVGTRQCATCPNNQWGSDPSGGRGKSCKNLIRVYLLQEGCSFPVLVSLPPTSTGNWRDYMKRLAGRMKSVYGVVTRIRLEKDKNDGGIVYSKAVFAKSAELTKEEKQAIKSYAEMLKPYMRSVAVDESDYNVTDDVVKDENNPY